MNIGGQPVKTDKNNTIINLMFIINVINIEKTIFLTRRIVMLKITPASTYGSFLL